PGPRRAGRGARRARAPGRPDGRWLRGRALDRGGRAPVDGAGGRGLSLRRYRRQRAGGPRRLRARCSRLRGGERRRAGRPPSLPAGLPASPLAALDDYGTAALGYAAGSAAGLAFILLRSEPDGILAVA